MRLRLLVATLLAFALMPAATANAAVERFIQAYDSPTYKSVFWPKTIPAQVGDTVTWRLTQPGNPRAATHDVWVVPPGTSAPGTRLGISFETPTVSQVVDAPGSWFFYCSIHAGLTPEGMNGTVEVGTTDPGPPVDPGKPWETGEEPPDPNALPNDTTAPTAWEEGDNVPPTLKLVRATATDTGARARVTVEEPVTVTARLKKGKKIVATKRVVVSEPGTLNVNVNLPARLRDKAARYRLQVWATDGVDLDSKVAAAWIDFKP
ncbi:cupredoxin domain-containing protein [Solirubrobacter sp. CPCC 204708]|uniref:Cupredoxin domain-containing protein n=1 Tax=Solirubrobacter deserti TaxID=2282478 RepID=A0ABT4RDV5_9ACTN|nr:cupredoxin domain-containing protein [Solirubrobacter deserti]MBE2314547.1 cupredoxin domain-containing protein [Solirubrobacter deserti]MDA0136551.1 cupredoxin domain-containing protein [Solirubrobacter deserti]